MEIIFIIIGIILGGVGIYFILRPKLNSVKSINEEINIQNIKAKEECNRLEAHRKELESIIAHLSQENAVLAAKQEEVSNSLAILMSHSETSAAAIKQKSLEKMQEQLDNSAQQLSQKFQAAEQEYKDTYLEALAELAESFQEQIAQKTEQIELANQMLNELTAKQNAAIEAAKRQEEKELALDKYKINITDLDLLEINRLREIAPYFRNPRAIYKIIWESYYRNLTTELINRVVGTGAHTGIYKITNLKNEKVYIGQAIELGNRWKDHIKAGLGIDTPNNKLYAAMMEDGVENFTFEVLEECDRGALNNREVYWIEFYQSQDWGYNMRRGGAAQYGKS